MIRKYYNAFYNVLTTIYVKLIYRINSSNNVVFKGVPEIIIHKTAIISISNNVVINSSNYSYHINMFGKCKLYADRKGAIIKIGENSRIHGTCIHAFKKIVIGNNCLIAANTQIVDGNGHELSFDNPTNRVKTFDDGKEIIIEDNVWIAANCIILGGTIIGHGSVISAGSVVKGVVPPNSIYGGNPAKLIKQF